MNSLIFFYTDLTINPQYRSKVTRRDIKDVFSFFEGKVLGLR